jgi:hypothetical protein
LQGKQKVLQNACVEGEGSKGRCEGILQLRVINLRNAEAESPFPSL